MKREQFAITAKVEVKILDYLVARLPSWITPDILTFSALFSSVIGGIFYVFAYHFPLFLLGVNLFLVIHWLTDSLDGRLARYRKTTRPNYGFYIDHMLDSISASFFLGGLTTSAITETSAWAWILALMLLAMVHSFLKTRVFDVFEMSIHQVGPTEARLGLILVNTLIFFFGNPLFFIKSISVRLIDLIGWLGVVIFVFFLVPEIVKTSVALNKKDRSKKS